VWHEGPRLSRDEYDKAYSWYRERKLKARRFLSGDWSMDDCKKGVPEP